MPLYFISIELLDLLTTYTGISLGFIELNSLGLTKEMITTKLAITVGVSAILYLKRKQKIFWVVPIVALLPVLWNTLNILLKIL